MAKNNIKHSTLSEILQDDSATSGAYSKFDSEENKVKQALLERPGFSVKARLIIMFLILFLVSAAVSVAAMFLLSMIDFRVQYISLSDKIANEIQHVRRIEKNYFLYNTDLSEVKVHVDNANQLLEQASRELGHVVGRQEITNIRNDLEKYSQTADLLIVNESNPEFKQSEEFTATAQELRNYGSKMLELSLDISRKERQLISTTILTAKRIHIILIIALLSLSIFIILNITRHIINRLNRLMEATQRFAEGDFTPITPRRKYKDEFSLMAIAFNHMMYELEKRQHLLVESHKLRAIGNLTAGVAHELNNPLNNIILTSVMLKEDYKNLSDEECQDMINDLVTQSERAQQVVENLLDFARKSETQTEYFHLDDLIEKAIQLVKNQIKMSKVKLVENISKNLPPIYGDMKLLTQVFLNLFINAIDAMPGGGTLTITVREEKKTGFLAVKVADTGSGIPDHLLDSIFNPFFTTKPVGNGTGLGLSVSRGIIEKHGGELEVQSKVDQGSTFIVYLPVVPIPADIKAKNENGQDNEAQP
jgi:two-component system NtrC family sensor kinase